MPDLPTLTEVEDMLTDAILSNDTEAIDHLGAVIDHLSRRPPPMLGASALWYAAVGLHVFPLQAMSKVPSKGFRWRAEATNDPATVRAWWLSHPEANIAIATGHLVDVIDVDGPVGATSWYRHMWSEDTQDYIGPDVLGKVSTPRPGGQHIYIAADPERTNHAGAILPGVDQRAAGGFVVAPPSRNPQGTYRWFVPLTLRGDPTR